MQHMSKQKRKLMKSNFISACEKFNSADKMDLFIRQELKNHCPIVEKIPNDNDHQLVTFIYHGIDLESVNLYSPLIGIFPIKMMRLSSSNYFYYSLVVSVNIRATWTSRHGHAKTYGYEI